MLAILILLAVATLLYYIAVEPFKYWSKRRVATGKIIPLFGDVFYYLFGRESMADSLKRMYYKLENARYIGCYQLFTPYLVIKSPELIKQICVKNFDHFLNHRSFSSQEHDDIFGQNLFQIKGEKWKNMRSTLSPSFTSSKMKQMFVLMCENAEQFVQYLLKQNEEMIEADIKDIFSRYGIDVIASTAFGIHINSLEDRDNEFYKISGNIGNFGSNWRQKIVFNMYSTVPKIAKFLKLRLFDEKTENFFLNIAKESMKAREEQNIKRPDMIGLLMESRKKGFQEDDEKNVEPSFAAVEEHLEMKTTNSELTDMDIASQLFIFFFGGFEAVSSGMCFMAYELAVNPDVQKKLIEEIDENRNENERPSYDKIASMTYLDMVLSETLRKWPIPAVLDRIVTKPFTIEPELKGEHAVHLEVNDNILVPIIAIHHDPKIYENPEKFDPERFSPENRHKINAYTYLPFGIGPRNCIGNRYALLKIKSVFFFILSNFEIVPTEKTQIPLKLCKKTLTLYPEHGFHLGLKRRR